MNAKPDAEPNATDRDLKQRLVEWASIYAGAQFRRLGYASTDRVACTAPADPPAPQTPERTRADEIESILRSMESSGRWRESRVLRAEYFLAGLPESERLQRLGRIGIRTSRAAYYIYLGAARAYVAGALAATATQREAA